MRTRRTVCALAAASIVGLAGCTETIPTRGSDAEDDRRREVLARYEDALGERNDGIETRDRAIERFNAAAYAEAIDEMETALEHLSTAADGFEGAAEAIETAADDAEATSDGEPTADVSAAREICVDAAANTRLQVEATEAGLAAARAADDDEDAGTINDHVEEYQLLVEEAEARPVADGETLADVLGF